MFAIDDSMKELSSMLEAIDINFLLAVWKMLYFLF